MKVQVFRGKNLEAARRSAQLMLGRDAVVLTSRVVRRNGVSGLFGSEVEVSAIAAEADIPMPLKTPSLFAPGVYATREPAPSASPDLAALRAEIKGDLRALRTLLAKNDSSSYVSTEIAALRELVETLATPAGKKDKPNAFARSIGIEGPAATALGRALRGKTVDADTTREALASILKAGEWPIGEESSLVAVIGPTGVGKTTTAAKLAAKAVSEGRSVTIIGCDTFRVGAIEQLARYAKLMQCTMVTARTPEELRTHVHNARTDLVVVDTASRPPAPATAESALAWPELTSGARARTRHVLLCAPATVRATDAERLVRSYGVLGPSALAITKLDETDNPAGLVHVSWASKLPVALLSTGPRVPEDVVHATVAAMVDRLVPRSSGKAAA